MPKQKNEVGRQEALQFTPTVTSRSGRRASALHDQADRPKFIRTRGARWCSSDSDEAHRQEIHALQPLI